MKASLLLIFTSLFYTGFLFCQNSKLIDSLLIVTSENSSSENLKIDAFNELAYQFRNSNRSKSRQYAEKALDLAIANQYEKGEGDSYVRLGIVDRSEGKYDKSRINYFKALKIREKLEDKRGIVGIYNNIALTYKNQGNYFKAKEYYKQGLILLKDDSPSKTKGRILLNLGIANRYIANYEEALINFNEAYSIFDEINFLYGKANVSIDKATLFIDAFGNIDEAEKSYNQALGIYDQIGALDGKAKCYMGLGYVFIKREYYPKALSYYDMAFQLKNYLNIDNQIKILKAKGNIYNETGQYGMSIKLYNQALKLAQNSDGNIEIASLNYNIGLIQQKMNEDSLAIRYFEKSLSILDTLPNPLLKSDILSNLSESYNKKGFYEKGFEIVSQSQAIKDSLNLSYIKGINLERNLAQAQSENEILKKEVDIHQVEQEKQQLFTTSLIIGILMLLGLVGITFAGYYQRQKRLEVEREIDHLLTDIELETTYARLEGQDTERKRIAQDLHDGLGSMLSTVKLYFGSIEEKIDLLRSENHEQKEQYEKATLLLDQACDEVRKVAHEMKSGTLAKFGLPAELESLAKIIRESKKIKVELLTHQMDERIDNKIESNLYRITQEIISNILKHAKATKISIELNRFDDIISLVIEDNGAGFDLEQAKAKGGMGIVGIEARVQKIGGTLNIDTQIGRGTSISIDVPYESES